MAGQDLYAILGLTPDATSQQVRTAYRNLITQAESGQVTPEQRQAIDHAYETLGDPIRRLRYDAQSAAPPPPRIQMPAIGLPNRRMRLTLPAVRRPALPHVPLLPAIAVLLVAAVAIFVLLTPLFRHGGKSTPPPQSVSDLVRTATPTAQARATAGAVGTTKSGAVLFVTPSATPLALRGVSGSGGAAGTSASAANGEPPFVSQQLLTDAQRAVAAASAVRNGPSQGTLAPSAGVAGTGAASSVGVPITSAASGVAASNSAAAGVPITSPLPSAAQPAVAAGTSSSTVPLSAANTPAPTRTPLPPPPELSQPIPSQPQPGVAAIVRSVEASASTPSASSASAPNRISVSTPAPAAGGRTTISAGGAPAPAAAAQPASAPNRFTVPATPVR